jgi:hypothetical protein
MAGPSSELRHLLVARYHFGVDMVDIAWRAGFRCEYCDKDMLGSVDAYHWNWEREHVVPTTHGGADVLENWALACRTCNQIKGAWDPRTDAGEDGSRDTLVAAARAFVQASRAERARDLDEVRRLISAESMV